MQLNEPTESLQSELAGQTGGLARHSLTLVHVMPLPVKPSAHAHSRLSPVMLQLAWESHFRSAQAWSNMHVVPSPTYGDAHAHLASPALIVHPACASHLASEHLSTHCVPSPVMSAKPGLHVQLRPPGLLAQ